MRVFILPQHRFRRAQNVKTPLLTGRTIPSLTSWFTSHPPGNTEVTLCHTEVRLIPGNKYKASRGDGRAPQWVAVMPDDGAPVIGKSASPTVSNDRTTPCHGTFR